MSYVKIKLEDLFDLRDQIQSLNQILEDNEDRLSETLSAVEALQEYKKDLESKNQALNARILDLQDYNGDFQRQVDSLREELRAARNQSYKLEPGSYTVHLDDFGENKISVIKALRRETGLGLKEAKDLVERGGTIVAQVSYDAAYKIASALVEAGAKSEVGY